MDTSSVPGAGLRRTTGGAPLSAYDTPVETPSVLVGCPAAPPGESAMVAPQPARSRANRASAASSGQWARRVMAAVLLVRRDIARHMPGRANRSGQADAGVTREV